MENAREVISAARMLLATTLASTLYTACKKFAMKTLLLPTAWGAQKTATRKALEVAWDTMFHSIVLAFGVLYAFEASIIRSAFWPWSSNVAHELWDNYPVMRVSWPTALLWIAYSGHYVADMCEWIVDPTSRRKDFHMMLLHHCVTLALLSLSLFGGMVRPASAVILLHEPSDIFLGIAKNRHYCNSGAKGSCNEWISHAAFFGVFMSWISFRFASLTWIWYTSVEEELKSRKALELENLSDPTRIGDWNRCCCCMTLPLLLILHVIWFKRIVRVGVRAIRNDGMLRDSDDEGGKNLRRHPEITRARVEAGLVPDFSNVDGTAPPTVRAQFGFPDITRVAFWPEHTSRDAKKGKKQA
jgi:hypothetical protein